MFPTDRCVSCIYTSDHLLIKSYRISESQQIGKTHCIFVITVSGVPTGIQHKMCWIFGGSRKEVGLYYFL